MRKILCGVLALVIILGYLTISYAEENNTITSDLYTEQKNLQNQIQQSAEELEGVKEELSENLQQVQKIDEKISNSEKEIEELDIKIKSLKVEIEQIEKQLDVAQKRYDNQKELLEARLIAIYEAGDTQYLDVILKSRNMSDFLSSYFLITELAQYDVELLNDVEGQRNIISLAKQKLDKSKESLTTALQQEVTTSKILQNTKTLRENYIAKLTDKEKETQAKVDEYTGRFAQINSEILRLSMQGIDTKYIGGVLAWPVPGYTRISSSFGMRVHPITGVYKLHTGVDVVAPMGANFVAANDGIVIKAEYNSAYGKMVIIDHGGGILTLYAHGSEILVQVGQTVTRNEPILKVGSTGYSTGAHAHFEVRIDGKCVDPIQYITNGIIPENSNSDEQQKEVKEETQ